MIHLHEPQSETERLWESNCQKRIAWKPVIGIRIGAYGAVCKNIKAKKIKLQGPRLGKTDQKMSTFAKMLRYSKFIQLGDFRNRILIGDIVHRVGEDLYVDMGLKFNAVCRAPDKSPEPE